MNDDRTVALRRAIYRFFAEHGRAPGSDDVGATQAELQMLEATHAVVLDEDGGIAFSNPFADGPTDFVVSAGTDRWYAICAWDALGILAATGRDGRVRTDCQDCGQTLELHVSGGELAHSDSVAHFLIPAARWYEDLNHT